MAARKKLKADKYRDRHVTLPPDLDAAIEREADKEGRTYTEQLRRWAQAGRAAEVKAA